MNIEDKEINDVQREGSEISSPSTCSAWMPIETAPIDGTRILCSCNNNFIEIMAFDKGDKKWKETYECWDSYTPTHWMPLPATPNVIDDIPET